MEIQALNLYEFGYQQKAVMYEENKFYDCLQKAGIFS